MNRVAVDIPGTRPTGWPWEAGCSVRMGVCFATALLLGARTESAFAAGFGGVAASLGLLSAVSALVLLKLWQTHILISSLSTLGGVLAALAAGALLFRRLPAPRRAHRSPASGLSVTGQQATERPSMAAPVSLPAEVDAQRLLTELRRTFIALQTAWDQGARDELGRMTTPDMLEDLCAARSADYGAASRSEVVRLDAHLVAFEERGATQLVCVEFSGLIRESLASSADPFRELWMLSRAKDASAGWRLARHQALL